MKRKEVWEKLIENKKEELEEIKKIVQPKTLWGKIARFYRHSAIEKMIIENVRFKHLKREVAILEQYNKEHDDGLPATSKQRG